MERLERLLPRNKLYLKEKCFESMLVPHFGKPPASAGEVEVYDWIYFPREDYLEVDRGSMRTGIMWTFDESGRPILLIDTQNIHNQYEKHVTIFFVLSNDLLYFRDFQDGQLILNVVPKRDLLHFFEGRALGNLKLNEKFERDISPPREELLTKEEKEELKNIKKFFEALAKSQKKETN